MNTVKVNVKELLAKLKENKKLHVEKYEESVKDYYEAVRVALRKEAKKEQPSVASVYSEFNKIPKNHASDYEKVITMLEWTEDDIVELDQGDFINYVMDNWSWSNEFITTNSFYASKVGKGV